MNSKRIISIIFTVIMISVALIAGTTFAFHFVGGSTGLISVVDTGIIKGAIKLSISDDICGIPGEDLAISKENIVVKDANTTGSMVFKVSYKIDAPNAKKIILGISLKESDPSLILVKDTEKSTNTELIYYGVLTDKKQYVEKNLGILYVDYNFNGNDVSTNQFDVITEFIGCQQTEEAIIELLKVNPIGKYGVLLG